MKHKPNGHDTLQWKGFPLQGNEMVQKDPKKNSIMV